MMHTASRIQKGFTIVELLIVIVIIAILAVISIVMYNGIQGRAAESAIQAGLRQASTQLDLDYVKNESYPLTKEAINDGRGLHESGVTFYYDSDGTTYCLTAVSGRSGIAPSHIQNGGSITTGACAAHVGLVGGSGSGTTTYSIFGSSAPAGTITLYDDGDGALRTGNRFYTTRPAGIKVVGLRVYSPAGAASGYLTETITARAYLDDWQNTGVTGFTTFGHAPVAVKTHSAARTAGSWQDIRFDAPINLARVTPGANGNDLVSLTVQFSSGDRYGIVTRSDGDSFESTVSGGSGVYLAEHSDLFRSIHNLSGAGVVDGGYVYLIDILYEDAD